MQGRLIGEYIRYFCIQNYHVRKLPSLLQIVVHLGLLTKASGWKFAEGAFKGESWGSSCIEEFLKLHGF